MNDIPEGERKEACQKLSRRETDDVLSPVYYVMKVR